MMKRFKQTFFLVAILLVVSLFATSRELYAKSTTKLAPSSEVGFASLSPRGLSGGAIIPASCEANTDVINNPLTSIDTGEKTSLGSGETHKAASHGNYCFGNSGGPTYFVPLNTSAEFMSFWNAVPGLSGVNRF